MKGVHQVSFSGGFHLGFVSVIGHLLLRGKAAGDLPARHLPETFQVCFDMLPKVRAATCFNCNAFHRRDHR